MRRMRLREWLVCLKVTVSDDQLITPMSAISSWFQPTAWLPCQLAVAIRYCEQGEWVYSHAIRSSWVSQQDESVGINMWQETNGYRWKALHLLISWMYSKQCFQSVIKGSLSFLNFYSWVNLIWSEIFHKLCVSKNVDSGVYLSLAPIFKDLVILRNPFN